MNAPVPTTEEAKRIFAEHGGSDLSTAIVSMYIELRDRCAELERRIAALEERRKR
jgi:hypothetical protein